jgi:hypothetical protein
VTLPIPHPVSLGTTVALAKPTLVTAGILVQAYIRTQGEIAATDVSRTIGSLANEMAALSAEHPLKSPDFENGLQRFVSSLPRQSNAEPPHETVESVRRECADALLQLEQMGLVEDPPWKTIGAGALMVLLGVTPVDFSVRTKHGDAVVRRVKVEAPLWAYRALRTEQTESWQVNLRAVEFAGESLRIFAERYLDAWGRHRPGLPRSRPPGGSVTLDCDKPEPGGS